MSVHRMVNPTMGYAWGSRDGIATLQGRPPAAAPEAELWMGAHPQAPSALEGTDGATTPLDAVIAADPPGVLGAEVVDRFGPRLPFLLKVLSAAEPLSLQVHPDDVQAEAGFAAEDAVGIERTAPHRSYRDPYAKPEMLVALTEFEALLGFRPAPHAAAVLRALDLAALDRVVEALESGQPTGHAFLMLADWPEHERAGLVAQVCSAAARSDDPRMGWVVTLAKRYPNDPGVVGVVLLNYVRLRPGQGIYVGPGQIHAYLRGTGIELLGGSDNVLRGGLTPKHVALDKLRQVLALDAAPPSVIERVASPDGVEHWPSSRDEFALRRLVCDGEPRALACTGPAIFLCIDGRVEVGDGDGKVTLGGGESAFVRADAAGPAILSGNGIVLCATVGISQQKARVGS